jgi:hypothetical protein
LIKAKPKPKSTGKKFSDIDPKRVVDSIKKALDMERVGHDPEADMYTITRRGSQTRFLSEPELLDLPRSVLHQILKIPKGCRMNKGDEKLVELKDKLIKFLKISNVQSSYINPQAPYDPIER